MNTQAELVSLAEYLRTDYDPDMEYVDGHLEDIHDMVQSVHGFLQSLISSWFNQREEWGVISGVEIRTQVSATRVRLPDVVVLRDDRDYPPTLIEPPLIVIEILSPLDTHSRLHQKGREYAAMGIRNIWLIDPEARTLRQWQNNAWQLLDGNAFRVADSPVYLDMAPLFARLDRHREKQ